VTASCEHGNELRGSIRSKDIPDLPSDCWLLHKDAAGWSYSRRNACIVNRLSRYLLVR
jgi:hypothetical protein